MAEEDKTTKDYAEDPDVQKFVADVTGELAEESLAKFEEKKAAEEVKQEPAPEPVTESEPVPIPVPAPAPVPAPKTPTKAKYAEPKAVTLDDITASQPVPAGPAVVGNGEVDDVQLSKIVYKNLYARKSLSVHHLQRRLAELGYGEAVNDKDGFYGDHTKRALARFQAANKLDGAGMVDAPTLTLLFTGDPNVNVVL